MPGTKGHIGENRPLEKLRFGKLKKHAHVLAQIWQIGSLRSNFRPIDNHPAAGG